jgi:hypothetical protein
MIVGAVAESREQPLAISNVSAANTRPILDKRSPHSSGNAILLAIKRSRSVYPARILWVKPENAFLDRESAVILQQFLAEICQLMSSLL